MKHATYNSNATSVLSPENVQISEDILQLEMTTHLSTGAIRAALVCIAFTILLVLTVVHFVRAAQQPASVSQYKHATLSAPILGDKSRH